MDKRTSIWSSGGGVQSTAIAALICQGELNPDLAIIVDTEREASSTWDYLDSYVGPALKAAGCDLIRVNKSDYATVDLYRADDILIPVYTDEAGGPLGKLPTYCSNEWKQRVMHRWATEQGVKQADIWIGFTIDEMQRCKQSLGKWQQSYPLIERRMSRGDCIALVESMGWPTPPRSSCWMCPNKSVQEWKEVRASQDWDKAVAFEQEIRQQDDAIYLHRSGKVLTEVNFNEDQGDLFTGRCDSGMCFV